MTGRNAIGQAIVAVGAAVIAIGFLVWSGALSWFGRLPGDLRIERPGLRIYVPFTSMLLASVVVSVILALVRRFWR